MLKGIKTAVILIFFREIKVPMIASILYCYQPTLPPDTAAFLLLAFPGQPRLATLFAVPGLNIMYFDHINKVLSCLECSRPCSKCFPGVLSIFCCLCRNLVPISAQSKRKSNAHKTPMETLATLAMRIHASLYNASLC